jgi:hypothetical protein
MATEPTEKHGKIIQAKQPNYNYHHEEREELQMEQLD